MKWIKVRAGKWRLVEDDYQDEPETPAVYLGRGGHILDPSDRRGVYLQTGVRVKTWGDAKQAMAACGLRVAERGERVLADCEHGKST